MNALETILLIIVFFAPMFLWSVCQAIERVGPSLAQEAMDRLVQE